MTLDVAYSYCINLSEKEKSEIDKKVRTNRFEFKCAFMFIFLGFPGMPMLPLPRLPFEPVEGFAPVQQIVRNARERTESAIAEKVERLAELAQECEEAYNQYKVHNKMSSTLSKVSKSVRKDKQTAKSLDKLEKKLKRGEFSAGRGARQLAGTKTIYYMRAGDRARLFFRYSPEEKGAIEKVAESNKAREDDVIANIKQNYD